VPLPHVQHERLDSPPYGQTSAFGVHAEPWVGSVSGQPAGHVSTHSQLPLLPQLHVPPAGGVSHTPVPSVSHVAAPPNAAQLEPAATPEHV
jgi:hypothetical protein